MTYKFLKTSIFSVSAIVMLVISSCTKPREGRTDFSNTSGGVVLFNGGLSNFALTAYTRGSDTVNLVVRVDLASDGNPSSPTPVTIAIDNAAIATYNAANPQPGYVSLPAANVKLLTTTLTIPAGEHYATTTLQIYTKGLDPAVSYMTPISITDASGKNLSSNLNTIYYHTIGNPLAGPYNWTFRRWSGTSDTTMPNNSTTFIDRPTSISPIGPTQLGFPESYINTFVDPAAVITLEFTNNAGVLSNFTGFLAQKYQDEVNDPAGFGGTLVTSSVLVGYQLVGNASTKYAGSTFRFYTSLKNSAGGIRTLIDNFVKL